jgi:hypothetical protein
MYSRAREKEDNKKVKKESDPGISRFENHSRQLVT